MAKVIEKLSQATTNIGKSVGKFFILGYLGGKVLESTGGRKTAYSMALGAGTAVVGTVLNTIIKCKKMVSKDI